MEMYRDEVEILILPETAKCLADEELRSPQEIMKCPLGNLYCNGDCECCSE